MYLSTDNAKEFFGKTLDAKKRILGDYPYRVIQTTASKHEYLAKGKSGVCVVIAPPNDRFNQIYFDIVDGLCIDKTVYVR